MPTLGRHWLYVGQGRSRAQLTSTRSQATAGLNTQVTHGQNCASVKGEGEGEGSAGPQPAPCATDNTAWAELRLRRLGIQSCWLPSTSQGRVCSAQRMIERAQVCPPQEGVESMRQRYTSLIYISQLVSSTPTAAGPRLNAYLLRAAGVCSRCGMAAGSVYGIVVEESSCVCAQSAAHRTHPCRAHEPMLLPCMWSGPPRPVRPL